MIKPCGDIRLKFQFYVICMFELEMLQRRSEKAAGASNTKVKQRLVIIEDTPPVVNRKSSGCC